MRIKKIELIDYNVQINKLENLTLIVGANSTGKTRLLKEVYDELTKLKNRGKVYWGKINIKLELLERDKKDWASNLVLDNQSQRKNPFKKGSQTLTEEQYKKLINEDEPDGLNINYGIELCHYLNVDSRLTAIQKVNKDHAVKAPSNSLNVIYRNSNLLTIIKKYIKYLFKKSLFLCDNSGVDLELKLSNDLNAPQPPKIKKGNIDDSWLSYQQWIKQNNISDITEEGHGLRAFMNILFEYMAPTCKILMIDEPEIHLHPATKRNFGRIIGELSKRGEKQFILVTHDSDFLQGVFDARCNISILKLFKNKDGFQLLKKNLSKEKFFRASQIQESFLQIPFLDCAILVEGVADRSVYEHVITKKHLLSNQEYKVIPVGGKDSFSNPERVAQTLQVPYAVILDFDSLKPSTKNKAKSFPLVSIKLLEGNDDLKNKIIDIGNKLHGIDNIKNLGIRAVENEILKNEVQALLAELKKLGVFVVPIGESESWGSINCNKHEFPEVFTKRFNHNSKKFKEMESFLTEVCNFLKNQLN